MIINTFDFFITTDTKVPNVGTNSDTATGNQSLLQWYIDTYEPEVLIKGLGRDLYELFIANFEVDRTNVEYGNLSGGSPPRFIDLLDGLTYTINGENRYWNGLRFRTDPSTNPQAALRSLLIYYVYYKYLNDNVDSLTDLGVAIEAVKNADIVDPTRLMVFVWREFIKMYGGITDRHVSRYGGHFINGFFVQDFSSDNTGEVSLFQYLNDNKDVYPEWEFTACQNINQFGI